jgi:hypothetical protein
MVDEAHTQRRGRLLNGNPSGDFLLAPRCGVRTRAGGLCGGPAMKNGRCRMHGGASTGPRTPEGLARSRAARLTHGRYSADAMSALKYFFQWLAGQPGYKSRIAYADAQYFNLSANESRVAIARRSKRVPTVEQIVRVLGAMPAGSEIEQRDRALIAFTLLTGARDGATVTFKLKHIDMTAGRLDQDANDSVVESSGRRVQ